jgi:hypothetical protein
METKRCTKCGETKSLQEFNKDRNCIRGDCKRCQYDVNEDRRRKTGYYRKHRIKCNARSAARAAKKSKRLISPSECYDCGEKTELQMHHGDYSKPLEVTWLCPKCHYKVHISKLKEG